MTKEYALWDACLKRASELQAQAAQQHKALEAARREYEAARASFYAQPTDEGLKTAMLGIDAVLGKLRAERGDTEASLAKVKATMEELQGKFRAHEEASFQRRLALVMRRTNRTDLSLQGEMGRRLDEATTRIKELTQALIDQKMAHDKWVRQKNTGCVCSCCSVVADLRVM